MNKLDINPNQNYLKASIITIEYIEKILEYLINQNSLSLYSKVLDQIDNAQDSPLIEKLSLRTQNLDDNWWKGVRDVAIAAKKQWFDLNDTKRFFIYLKNTKNYLKTKYKDQNKITSTYLPYQKELIEQMMNEIKNELIKLEEKINFVSLKIEKIIDNKFDEKFVTNAQSLKKEIIEEFTNKENMINKKLEDITKLLNEIISAKPHYKKTESNSELIEKMDIKSQTNKLTLRDALKILRDED